MSNSIVVLACMDKRIKKTLRLFLENSGYPEGTYYTPGNAGCSLAIKDLEKSLDVALKKENGAGLEEIWLFDHEDCAAYKYYDQDDSKENHVRNLKDAGGWLKDTYGDLRIRYFFVSKINDSEWQTEEI